MSALRTAAVPVWTGMPGRRTDSAAGYTDLGRVVPLLRGPEYSITQSLELAVSS